MSEQLMPLDPIAQDAIRYRLIVRDQAEANLSTLMAQVLAQAGVPGGQIRIELDGSMVAIAPDASTRLPS